MKKLLLFIFVIAIIKINAQGYQKLLADSITEFDIMGIGYGVRLAQPQQILNSCVQANNGIWTAVGDSLYKGKTYKRMSGSNVGFQGLIREDTGLKKIYFIDYCDTIEYLLYDFSLLQGNTINYTFLNSAGVIQSGTFTVDSILIKHDYKNYYHKHFYLRNHSTSDPSLEIIEGVGNINHPLFLFYPFMWGGGSFNCSGSIFDEVLSCKIDNGKRVYYDSCIYTNVVNSGGCFHVTDTCTYQNNCGAINSYNVPNAIKVYPNPSDNRITVQSGVELGLIVIYNTLGETVFQTKTKNFQEQIDISKLPAGIYTIQAQGKFSKLVKE